MLSYLNVAFALLALLTGFSVLILVVVAEGLGAYGIANERRAGYRLCGAGAVVALAVSVFDFLWWHHGISVIGVLFAVVLVALLFHPQSREYQKIWFR